MRKVGDTLEFGTRECSTCWGRGRVAGKQSCPKCKGTGNGPKGGIGSCRGCHGFRTVPDFENTLPCPSCHGSCEQPETLNDFLPREVWQAMEFRVYRAQRRNTWNEEYLALGCVWSCSDYGRAWAASDEKVIADVRDSSHRPQASRVYQDGRFCNHVAIVVTLNGYQVKAVWDETDPTPDHETARILAKQR